MPAKIALFKESTPLQQELHRLCDMYIPEEDLLAIKTLIKKYYTDKKQRQAEDAFEEFSYPREDIWLHDPFK